MTTPVKTPILLINVEVNWVINGSSCLVIEMIDLENKS